VHHPAVLHAVVGQDEVVEDIAAPAPALVLDALVLAAEEDGKSYEKVIFATFW
jgi:hypothetical protein